MGIHLGHVLTSLMLVGVDDLGTQQFESRLEFPPGSKWELVRGWKGTCPVGKARVEFLRGKKVQLTYDVRSKGGDREYGTILFDYENDPKTILFRPRHHGTFRMVGNRLELTITEVFTKADLPSPIPGDLRLILKPWK
jgi:hypothetical protein